MPRLHRKLMQLMLGDIVCGLYAAGQLLPPENDLAKQFGASRGVVRESIRGLEERGLVAVQQGRGAVVCDARDWNVMDAEVLAILLETPGSGAVLSEFLECRIIVETEAAALAAQRASSADLSRMADALLRMRSTAARAAQNPAAEDLYHEADIAFHNAIFLASGNRVLPRIVEPIQRAMYAVRPRLAIHPERRITNSLPQHEAILNAIVSRDPGQARQAMANHLATVEDYLVEFRTGFDSGGLLRQVSDG